MKFYKGMDMDKHTSTNTYPRQQHPYRMHKCTHIRGRAYIRISPGLAQGHRSARFALSRRTTGIQARRKHTRVE